MTAPLLSCPSRNSWWVIALGVAGVNVIAGRLSLLLAIPPGYATAIWPPAGIALAALLVWGYRVWPGVWLGAFVINASLSFDATSVTALARSIAIPSSIGVGSTLQALLGAWLIRRFVGFPHALDRGRAVVSFLLVGGPISCVVAATWGVTTLFVSQTISAAAAPFSWWTWWVGDTLGVIIFTPLLFVGLATPRELWRSRRTSVAFPLSIAFAIAIVVFAYARAWETSRVHLTFERDAGQLAYAIEGRLEQNLETLQSLESFYAGSVQVERDAFRIFVTTALARHPEVQALEWIPRVPKDERLAYEHAARAEGYPAFHITERTVEGRIVRAEQREEYFPIYYVEPYAGNEIALGFDMASEPTRREALQQARDTAQMVATGRVTLVQETEQQSGALVFLPIYRNGVPHATLEERRTHLQGFGLLALRLGTWIQTALTDQPQQGIEFRVIDQTTPQAEQVLFVSSAQPEVPWDAARGLVWTSTYPVAGRQWVLQFRPTLDYLAAHRPWGAWLVLAWALAIVALLQGFLLIITGAATRTEQLVVERTAALRQAQTALQEWNQKLEQRIHERTQELQATHEQLRHSEQLAVIGRLTAGISHDLRTPLATLTNATYLLTQKLARVSDPEVSEYLQLCSRELKRMQGLISDILEFNRPRAPHVAAVAMPAVLKDAMGVLRPHIEAQGIEVRSQVPERLPPLQGDSAQLTRVFTNLLSNAVQAMPDGGRLDVEVVANNGQVQVAIHDTGSGMDDDTQQKLFTPFFTTKPRGIGLGLVVAKQLVEAHRGTIEVESQPGQGTTFRVLLPIGESRGVTT